MEGALVNSQVQRWHADEFFAALQVQRNGAALRDSEPICGARKCGFAKRAIAGQRMRSSRCKACASPKSTRRSIIRCTASAHKGADCRRGSDGQSDDQPFSVQCSGAAAEREQVESLYKALTEAKKKSGEKVSGNLDSFAAFVKKKTSEIRKQHGCDTVVYSVEMQGGQVKLKAKAKDVEQLSVLSLRSSHSWIARASHLVAFSSAST